MKNKDFGRWFLVGGFVIALVGCSKGLDRKLDFSGTAKQFGESYGEAMAGAKPDEQNVLRDRMMEVTMLVTSLAEKSNPAVVDANIAKKNADELQHIKNMTVREIFIWYLGKEQEELSKAIPALEKFNSDKLLKIENIEIQGLNPPRNVSQPPSSFEIAGVLSVRNDSTDFDYDFRGCDMYLSIDGRRIKKNDGSGQCDTKFYLVKAGGDKQSVKFNYRIYGKEAVQNFFDFLNDPEKKKTSTWEFDSSQYSYIKSGGANHLVYETKKSEVQNLKDRLSKISTDLSYLNK